MASSMLHGCRLDWDSLRLLHCDVIIAPASIYFTRGSFLIGTTSPDARSSPTAYTRVNLKVKRDKVAGSASSGLVLSKLRRFNSERCFSCEDTLGGTRYSKYLLNFCCSLLRELLTLIQKVKKARKKIEFSVMSAVCARCRGRDFCTVVS